MKRKMLNELVHAAASFECQVREVSGGVEVECKAGRCFAPELHTLVSVQWDGEPMPNVLRRAIRDIEANGPLIQDCRPTCEWCFPESGVGE